MSDTLRILAFAGSTRRESFNKKLVQIAAAGAREAGADVTDIDLRDYRLPVFDQDHESEQGKPDHAKALKQMMIDHDAFLIAAPEYNSSITGVLKNSIDWVSRPDDGEAGTSRGVSRQGRHADERLARCPRRSPRAGPPPINPRQSRMHRPAEPGGGAEGPRSVQGRRHAGG